jgi:hypothetical protein
LRTLPRTTIPHGPTGGRSRQVQTLIKAAEVRFNPLEDQVMAEVVPARWSGPHVGVRISDAFNTLSRLPSSSFRTRLGFWPAYSYSWQDLLAQLEQAAEEQARERHIANRVRVKPDITEVSQMERAIYWPMQYLAHEPLLVRAVNAMAFAHAIGRDVVWLARKRGGDPNLWQHGHWSGCELIARGLVRDKVGVF